MNRREKKKQREKYKADMQADIDLSNSGYDSQISSTQDYYDKQIDDTKASYDGEYQKNAVQKLINEKQVAEKMANLGLTDSGLNRTQQTAVQLSYANQKGKIDLARQSALDNLSLAMTDAITTLQNQKAASARDITKQWNDYADTQAQNIYNTKYNGYVDMYNAQAEADAEVQKAAIDTVSANNNFVGYTYSGRDDDGNSIFYKDGKKYTYERGVNPYTGTTHKDTKYGTFSNGYQPNNIAGVKLTPAENKNGGIAYTDITGKKQTIWECGGRYYVWYGNENIYKELYNASELGLT